jgi:hypothetical protein
VSNIDLNDTGNNLGEGAEPGALASLGADEQDIILAAEGLDKKRRSGPLILIGVVVLAAGALFSMRTLTRVSGSGPTPIDAGVEKYLRSEAGGPDTTAAELLAQLTDVKPTERAYVRDLFLTAPSASGPTVAAGPTAGTETGWQAACKRATDKLKVTSVMRDLLANINKSIVQLGGTVVSDGIQFRVIEITNEGITVEALHAEQGWRFEQPVGVKRGF